MKILYHYLLTLMSMDTRLKFHGHKTITIIFTFQHLQHFHNLQEVGHYFPILIHPKVM